MSDDFCLIHGYTLKYDLRSGTNYCPHCEREKALTEFLRDPYGIQAERERRDAHRLADLEHQAGCED